jgi:hypothetical protein
MILKFDQRFSEKPNGFNRAWQHRHSSITLAQQAILNMHSLKLPMSVMRKSIIILLLFFLVVATAQAQTMTCGEFNSLGVKAITIDEAVHADATLAQAKKFRDVIALHADVLSRAAFTTRSKTLHHVMETDQITTLVRESLAITRAICFTQIHEPMQKVATEQFDYLLDAIAKRIYP